MERRLRLRHETAYLWTRERGAAYRAELDRVLRDSGPGDIVVLDLAGIETFDFSFANEFFGRALIALPKEYPGRALVVEGLNDVTRENLQAALDGLSLAIVERTPDGPWALGAINAIDRATFTALARLARAATSAELTNALGINLTAANERLAKLARLGIVLRVPSTSTAGREQFLYSTPL